VQSLWTCSDAELTQFRLRVRAAVQAADHRRTVLSPGDHCQYCPVQNCEARTQAALAVLPRDVDGNTPALLTPQQLVDTLSPARLAELLSHKKQIEDTLDAAYKHALSFPPPGWKVVAGQARRRWRGSDEETIHALNHLNIAPRLTPVTVTDALHAVTGVEAAQALVNSLIEAPAGAPKLVPESDPRPALDRAAVFAIATDSGGTD
jgi:hypothetical protein